MAREHTSVRGHPRTQRLQRGEAKAMCRFWWRRPGPGWRGIVAAGSSEPACATHVMRAVPARLERIPHRALATYRCREPAHHPEGRPLRWRPAWWERL